MNANKRNKNTTLIFDENKRKEFLCGFRKRKIIRQEKAQEKLQQQVLTKQKTIKKNVQANYQRMYPADENSEFPCKKMELEGHTICILDLNIENVKRM